MAKNNDFPQKLLVEGKTDQHVVWALCEHYQVEENFNVVDCDGINNLLDELKMRLTNPSNVKTIGVILDADNDLDARLEQIRNIIKPYGYETPKKSPPTGLICSSPDTMFPKLGFWLMPDNVNFGMVEDFALSLAPDDDPLLTEAESVLRHIEELGVQKYIPNHRSKAKIHTYLAWQDEPGAPIGQSITKRVFNPDYPLANVFVQNWLIPLFRQDS